MDYGKKSPQVREEELSVPSQTDQSYMHHHQFEHRCFAARELLLETSEPIKIQPGTDEAIAKANIILRALPKA
jgi:hypothetical protein